MQKSLSVLFYFPTAIEHLLRTVFSAPTFNDEYVDAFAGPDNVG